MHYTRWELKLYKDKILSKEELDQIANHLIFCENCREEYISLISEEEVNNAGKVLSQDFTFNLMEKIREFEGDNKPINTGRYKTLKKKRTRLEKIMVNYSIAASITILVTASGLFAKPIVNLNAGNITAIQRVYRGSEKLTSKFSKIMDYNPYKEGLYERRYK